MNPSAKSSYDKINQYRQKIKQTIMSQQSGTQNQGQRQQRTHKEQNEYPKITSSLSRSNIRKNPNEVLNLSRNLEQDGHRMQDDPRVYMQSRVSEQIRIDDRNVDRSRVDDRSKIQEKSRISDKSRIQEKNKPYDNQDRVSWDLSRVDIPIKTAQYIKSSQVRTTQKPSTSKSPTVKTNPYLQEPQTITKRKNSVKQIQKSTPKPTNPTTYEKTPSFKNLSAFDTFSPRLHSTTGFPPIFGRLTPSSQTAEHQVKILLEENKILSLHLNEKMQRIKSLQRELKTIVKSQILHQEKYDIEVSQLNAEKSMIKKSSEEQVKTLVMQVKKLNDELVEKQQAWQQRLNMIRKTNLQEQQDMRKNQMKMQEKYKSQIEELKIKLSTINQELKTSKQTSSASIQNLKTEMINLSQSKQKITHLHKMGKSQQALEHDHQVKVIKEEFYRKIEILNLDNMRKENQLNGIIDSLSKELKKVSNQMEDLKHEKEFSQVKDMQQKGKMMIEIRQEKENIEKMKHQENNKLQKLSEAQFQAMSQAYEHEISQLKHNVFNLESLLNARAQQITNLYKEIAQTRKNYQNQLSQRDKHINNLQQKISQLNSQFIEQQQCFKIKMAEITQANQQTLKDIYENKISEQQHLLIDKEQIISKLRQKIAAQLMHASEINELHQKEVKEYFIRIEGLEQKMSSNTLKEKNTNVSMDKENIILKQNLLRQSESYQKVAIVKEQSIKRLQKIIQTKDKQIEQLQQKVELLKKSHKQQIHLVKQQHNLMIREQQDIIIEIKQQLDYAKRDQSKRSQQFLNDKQYFSNQLRDLKNSKETEFNQCIQKMYSEINDLKMENQDLKMKLTKVNNQYEEYQKLWNQEESLNKLLAKEKQFMDKMNEAFTVKTQKIIEFYEHDINDKYKPKIAALNELIVEKDQQILDMKTNYHQLEMKFEKFMDEKQVYAEITEKVLTLGKSNDAMAKNFVIPGR